MIGKKPPVSARQWRKYLLVSLLVIAASLLSISPYLTSSTELVRIRNALLLLDNTGQRFDWTPGSIPPDFMIERGPADSMFVEASKKLGLEELDSDWKKVLAISRHLLSHPSLTGPPIQSNLRDTYRRIVENGDGYCGDFTRVFMGFAIAAGIPVRAWAFSLDGFGGHGHVWPEIWNKQAGKWQLVDIYNNFYFHQGDGIAVSAAEFRQSLLNITPPLHRELLYKAARPGYEFEEKMWTWYRQGAQGWYMIWGNNVFSYDNAMMTLNLGRYSRALEQFEAIARGIYPPVSLLIDETNRNDASALFRLRAHLFLVGIAGIIAAMSASFCTVRWRQALRRSGGKSQRS